jgi:DNA-directed RNA polymerase subunit L
MEIKVIENTKNKLLFQLEGYDHTFCNMLKEELWNDSDVKVSAYRIQHPLVSVPEFVVETSKKTPMDAVLAAIKRINSLNKKFLTEFKKI